MISSLNINNNFIDINVESSNIIDKQIMKISSKTITER